MHTFYIQNITANTTFPETESKHAIKVLRLKNGDQVRLVNGQGLEAYATIISDHHKRCEVAIFEQKERAKSNRKIAIALAPTKNNDRTEWFLEKAIEIGLTDFIPILCKNSERKKFNTERWEKVAISALKQSQRLWKTTIHEPIKLEDFLATDRTGLKSIAYCGDFKKQAFKAFVDQTEDQLILIGPEGDFTAEETALAFQKGYQPVTLGENRLRTETAGVVACTLMQFS
ncbi:MAG: 16S rRNA (uracil(1498)-N(3))-methyltransferase [Flavobacteriales bacterium]|jgi:16S rRNA (uracil1498-N3)-methyltransferase|nr:16S rRNA (uracil(1498)-N(3))-methyltransferase [Flavobacteriales bacterium]